MKKVSLIVLSLLGALSLSAQSYKDALRYSESFPEGNARYMAMGGALSSLGGNISAMSVNPAGSAVFKKSVVEFTPCYVYTKSDNEYLGKDNAFTSTLKVPSFGIVGYKSMKQNDLFISGLTFGFAMNAQNRYHETLNFAGYNDHSSLSDDFIRLYRKGTEIPEYNVLAYDAYLLDYDEGTDVWTSDFVDAAGNGTYGEYQDIEIQREGAKREFLFNFGMDFSEYVFFGADLSFSNFYYNESMSFTESDDNDDKEYLNSFSYLTDMDVTGNAVGGKFGLIVRPIEYIRIGGAIHTPVVYNITEDYEAAIDALFDKGIDSLGTTHTYEHCGFPNDYKIGQPAKFVGSLGFVYKNVLNIGVDFEHMNYSACELRDVSSKTDKQIDDELTSVNNIKCGAEFRYGPFTFRGGYATYGNPYKNAEDNFYRRDISGGVGLATNTFYYDLAVVNAKTKQQSNLLYTDLNGDVYTNSTVKRTYIMFTAGFKF